MKLINRILLAILVVSISTAYAQDDTNTDKHQVSIVIPTIALLDIESAGPNNIISITLDTPTEAGDALADKTDNSLWLNVTSIIVSGGRNISVIIDAEVAGLDLKVLAAGCITGYGSWGSPQPELILNSTSSQNLVTGIKSGYTLNGDGKGYQLTYTVSPQSDDAFGDLVAGTKNIKVTYTLTTP